MAAIYEPTTAEVLAAGYLYERDQALSALGVAFEAMDKMREVAEGKHIGNEGVVCEQLNNAQRIIEETFMLCGEGGEPNKFRNGLDNILAALKAAPGLPIECLSREDQAKWTDTITGILMALGPYDVTAKQITIMEYMVE